MKRGKFRDLADETLLTEFAKVFPDHWLLTAGVFDSTLQVPANDVFLCGSWVLTPTQGVVDAPEGWWVFQVPVSLRDRFDENGQPRERKDGAAPPASMTDLDPATGRLVYSAVPRYRNKDKCPVPGCIQKGYFKQMEMCCPYHGAWANHQRASVP